MGRFMGDDVCLIQLLISLLAEMHHLLCCVLDISMSTTRRCLFIFVLIISYTTYDPCSALFQHYMQINPQSYDERKILWLTAIDDLLYAYLLPLHLLKNIVMVLFIDRDTLLLLLIRFLFGNWMLVRVRLMWLSFHELVGLERGIDRGSLMLMGCALLGEFVGWEMILRG